MKTPKLNSLSESDNWMRSFLHHRRISDYGVMKTLTQNQNTKKRTRNRRKRNRKPKPRLVPDGGDKYMIKSPALFKVAKRRPKAKYKEMMKCSSSHDNSVDRISMLPDELLGCILSHITLKEQIATSILSRRWRYLWTLTTRLDLDGIDPLARLDLSVMFGYKTPDERVSALKKVMLDYVNWVNHVLASCKGPTIEDFRVYSDLGKPHEGYINKWLRYALACKVRKLELNLNAALKIPEVECYVFPDWFFSHIDEEVGSNTIQFKQLKEISLNYVGVNGQSLEFLLHNCPLLEDLSVSKSPELLSLKIIGPFPSLQCLEISNCFELKSIEICDVNLVCFKYSGRAIRFCLRNLPMLVHISVSTSIFEYMKVHVPQFSSILRQLEILRLDLRFKYETFFIPAEMRNLKQLVVLVSSHLVGSGGSLLWLTDIIHSAPWLQKFVVESGRRKGRIRKRTIQRNVEESCQYPHLKEVEFVGFLGVPSDLEFLYHFVDNAVGLKKIIVNTKETRRIPRTRQSCIDRYNILKDSRDELIKQVALDKPWIKVEFLIAPS